MKLSHASAAFDFLFSPAAYLYEHCPNAGCAEKDTRHRASKFEGDFGAKIEKKMMDVSTTDPHVHTLE